MTRPPSLTVDRNTTLTQLREFTDDLKDTKRLRGKENKDGSITLYVKDTKRGLGSQLFGHSEKSKQKQDLARAAVMQVLTNTERSIGGPLLRHSRVALESGLAREMKVASIKLLGMGAQQESTDKRRPEGPGLDKAGTGVTNVLDWRRPESKTLPIPTAS